jgi:hypothetical protein
LIEIRRNPIAFGSFMPAERARRPDCPDVPCPGWSRQNWLRRRWPWFRTNLLKVVATSDNSTTRRALPASGDHRSDVDADQGVGLSAAVTTVAPSTHSEV